MQEEEMATKYKDTKKNEVTDGTIIRRIRNYTITKYYYYYWEEDMWQTPLPLPPIGQPHSATY